MAVGTTVGRDEDYPTVVLQCGREHGGARLTRFAADGCQLEHWQPRNFACDVTFGHVECGAMHSGGRLGGGVLETRHDSWIPWLNGWIHRRSASVVVIVSSSFGSSAP